MVTDISPILGLNILGILEIIAIWASIALPVAIGLSIWVNFKMARNQESRYNDQIERQTKVDSANLVYKLQGAWRAGGKFTDLLNKIRDPDAVLDPDKDEVYPALDLFEDIAVLWNDKTLDDLHVKEFFGTNLANVKNNHSMMGFLESEREKNPDYYYCNLARLLDRVEEWKIGAQSSEGRLPPEPP